MRVVYIFICIQIMHKPWIHIDPTANMECFVIVRLTTRCCLFTIYTTTLENQPTRCTICVQPLFAFVYWGKRQLPITFHNSLPHLNARFCFSLFNIHRSSNVSIAQCMQMFFCSWLFGKSMRAMYTSECVLHAGQCIYICVFVTTINYIAGLTLIKMHNVYCAHT